MPEGQQLVLVQQIQTIIMTTNNSLINKTRVKRKCLQIANDVYDVFDAIPSSRIDADGKEWNMSRALAARTKGKFTQVSQSLLDELDRDVRKMIYERVTRQPQSGKTVK